MSGFGGNQRMQEFVMAGLVPAIHVFLAYATASAGMITASVKNTSHSIQGSLRQ